MSVLTLGKSGDVIRRWAITIGANIGSLYILDIIASAFGLGLVAALGLLAPQALAAPMGYILAFLLLSYAVWAYTLAKNLKANWRLLEETGTSTNVLSKVFHDLTTTSNLVFRKVSTGAGYVVTELAKEIPYYAAAFGAAAASEAITFKASLLFLAGANLGAAVYEYALAFGTLRMLSFLKK